MPKQPIPTRLKDLPVPILPAMVGTATLSNMWSSLGFSWIRHVTMLALAFVILCYIGKIILHFDTVKLEYNTTVPASLYAAFPMLLMILGSYVFDFNPAIGKGLWIIGLGIDTVHILTFIYRNAIKSFNIDTFIPSWFVTFNGIMVSTVVGVPMNEPIIGKIVVYYGILALIIVLPLMVIRLIKKPITTGPLFMTKAILLAPSSLCLVSYLNFIKEPNVWVIYILYGVVFVTLIYILINLVKFFSFTFHPGFAALTFPMAIGCVASSKMSGFLISQGYESLGGAINQLFGFQLFITTAIIAFVLFNFLLMFIKKEA